MVAADIELHLRLIYRQITGLQSAAVNLDQQRQATAVRNRVTAELVRRGWRVTEIAAALGLDGARVGRWHDQGCALAADGLALPYPAATKGAGPGAGRLSVSEVAQRLQVDGSTVRRWIKHGHIPAARASNSPRGRWVIEAAALDQFSVPGGRKRIGRVRRPAGEAVRVIVR
jgi:excisionase family DNA binding protein